MLLVLALAPAIGCASPPAMQTPATPAPTATQGPIQPVTLGRSTTQTTRIEGRVFRSDSGAVIIEAAVNLTAPNPAPNQPPIASTKSDLQGRFALENVKPGMYTIGAGMTFPDTASLPCLLSGPPNVVPGVSKLLSTLTTRTTRSGLKALVGQRDDGAWIVALSVDPFDLREGDVAQVSLDVRCD